MIDESDVMLWLSENSEVTAALTRRLPRHQQVAIADMLISMARAGVESDADWQQLISRHVTSH
jgi:hypothetical protein